MRLVQRGFPSAEMRDGYGHGWGSILDGLERVVRARRTTFVLIPGAWLGGWVWEPVASRLRARGYRVRPVTLSGLHGHGDASAIGLSTHVDDVLAVIEGEDLRDVIVVGHLYSGLVAGQVADRLPDRVAHTVFVESFLPADGRAMVDVLTDAGREEELRAVEENDGRWPPPTPDEVADGNGLSPDESRRLAERFVPHPGRTIAEPATLSRPLAEQPATYIASTMGGHSTLADVAALRDEPNWTFRAIDTGHWPMVSAPDELAELLAETAVRAR
jgi:pimeloyl-ACP methyl ester carboxylesterase